MKLHPEKASRRGLAVRTAAVIAIAAVGMLGLQVGAASAAPAQLPTSQAQVDQGNGNDKIPPGQEKPKKKDKCRPVANPDGGKWKCTWADEFNGTGIDTSVWSDIPYGLGLACASSDADHVRVSGGTLKLLVTENNMADENCEVWGVEGQYTGGFIQTQGAFAQNYGRFEMRAKLPSDGGAWPAFWLLPDDNTYDGEIDIIEAYGGRVEDGGDVVDFTVRAPAGQPGVQETCRVFPDSSSDFHTYTLEWTPTEMRQYVDGELCATFLGQNPDGSPGWAATFDKPYHVLLDLAMQPWWGPNEDTTFPIVMEVDYVRVWR